MLRLLLVVLTATAILTGVATRGRAAECNLSMFPAKLVDNQSGAILISVQPGDKPAVFMLDTGGFWSVIRRRDVGDLPLRHAPVVGYGAGGTSFDSYVRIPSFKIGPGDLPNVDFMVVPDEMAADDRIDGALGANFLHNFDLEIDLANNVVNFFTPSGCGERAVYWPNQGVAAVPLVKDDSRLLHVTMNLDGKPVRTLIDTGASQTILSLAAADDLFDLHPDSPGVESAGNSTTADGKELPLLRHQFRVLALGGIQFLNPWLTLAEDRISWRMGFGWRSDALILGTHQLRQLHLYISYKDRMLYATASAGPVTGAPAGPAQAVAVTKLDPLDWRVIHPLLDSVQNHMRARQPDLALADATEIIRRYPNAAVGYVNRGLLEARTGKLEDAVADFGLAIKIAPAVEDYYAMRSRVLKQLHRDELAKADLDQAIALDPKQAVAYRARAALLLSKGDYRRAQADLDQAVTLGPPNARVYAIRAELQAKQGHDNLAVDEIDRALALSPRSSPLHNDSCWYRAILGQLDAALAACDQAVALDPRSAAALDSRGFVKLKLKRPTDAIADYDAAIALRPTFAGSLYGRGLAKQARGDAKGGKADLLAAQKLQPDIAETFGR